MGNSKFFRLLILFSFLIISMGFGHEADPKGLLSNYAIFGKDGISLNGSASTPLEGWVGTNIDFNQTLWAKTIFNSQVRVGGNHHTQISVYNDSLLVNGTLSGSKPALWENPASIPILSFDPIWTINNGAAGPVPSWNDGDTLPPGHYTTLNITNQHKTIVFTAGEYYFDNLQIAGGILIDKGINEFCRIFVKDKFELNNTGACLTSSISYKELPDESGTFKYPAGVTKANNGPAGRIVTKLAGDYGRVLIYTTAIGSDVKFSNITQFDATFYAPNAEITLSSEVIMNGQIIVKKLTASNNMSGGEGTFVKFISSNIVITPPESFPEDSTITDGSDQFPHVPNSYDTIVVCSLTEKVPSGHVDNQINLYYTITKVIDSDSDDDIVVNPLKGVLIFNPTKSSDTIDIRIIDDAYDDNDETFTIKFDSTSKSNHSSMDNFDVNLADIDSFHVIKIIDDDPSNTKPVINGLTPATIKENQTPPAQVGSQNISVTDAQNNLDTVKVINASASMPFATTGAHGLTLVATSSLDFEASPNTYAVQIEASDSMGLKDTAIINVSVTPLNDSTPKTGDDLSNSVNENTVSIPTSLQIDVAANDNDGDLPANLSTLNFQISTAPQNGSVAPGGTTGTFVYTPDVGFVGVDSFYYKIVDGVDYLSTYGYQDPTSFTSSPDAKVRITVNAVNNHNPVAINKTATLNEGGSATISNLFTDGDLPNDSHTIQVTKATTTGAGSAAASGLSIVYTASPDVTKEIFTDVVEFTVTDEVNHVSNIGTITLTINPLNDNNPNPSLDTITVIQGDITTFKHNIVKTDNSNGPDTDLDEHPTLSNTNNLKITTVTGEDPQYCQSLVINDNFNITYNVDPNEFIPAAGIIDILEYSISDAVVPEYDTKVNSGTDSVFVKIIRNPDSDPIAVDDNIVVKEGKSITFNVMTNDGKKVADLKNVIKATDPAHGTVLSVGDSSFTYTHDDTETESDSFTYTLWDEAGYTKTATVYITIELLNDHDPIVVKQTVGVIEGELDKEFKVLTVPAIESDTDLRTNFTTDTTGIGANGGAKYGTLIKVDEYTYRYSQDKDATGVPEDTVIMYVHDNVAYDPALRSQLDTTIFPITPSNDYPPTTTDFNITIKELEDTVIDLNGFIDDDDLPDDVLTLTIKSQTGKAGTATFDNAAKTITYTADPDVTTEEFDDIIVYTISDDGGHSTDGTINMTIEKLNDNNPVAVMDTVNVYVGTKTNITPLLNDTDPDSAFSETTLKLDDPAIVTQPTKAIRSLTRENDNVISIDYDPALVTVATIDSFEYRIVDPVSYPDPTVNNATGWVYINVLFPDNTLPTAVDDEIIVDENEATSTLVSGATSIKANDIPSVDFGSALEDVAIVTNVQHGSLNLNTTTGEFTYDHDDDKEIFFDFFTYTVTDADGYTSPPATVTITINKKNDNLPVITGEAITVEEGGSKSVNVVSNDTDVDVQTQWITSIDISKPATLGTVIKNADGTFTYTHNGSDNPVVGNVLDSFFITVVDTNAYDVVTHPTENKVIVTITPDNDNDPIANDGTFPTIKEGQSTTLDISSLYSDADMPNDVLTVEIVNETTPAGSASIAGNIVTYQHDITTEIFSDQIIYKVTDSEGNSDNGTLSITIEPLNDNDPVVTNDTISVRQGTPLTFTVTGNDTDADVEFDSTFLKILSNTAATRGTVVKVDDSTFTYTMNIDFEIIDGVSDVDSFTYIITDSVGYDTDINQSAPGMVYINLLKDEQGYPKTLPDTLALKENELVSSVWSIRDNDTMGFAGLKSIDIVSSVSHGVLTVDPVTGVFTYDHDDAKEEFSDQFIYTLTDSVGNVSNASLVTLVIDTLNDNVPVVANENLSVDEGATATINVLTTETDADIFTTLTPTLAGVNGGAKHGTATVTPDGTLTYVQDGVEGVQADTVIINITDVTTYDLPGLHTVPDTVFIQVAAVNNNTPSGTAPSYTIKEGETLSVVDSLLGLLHDATDADLIAGNALSAVLVTKPLYHNEAVAPFAINANGTFTYIHDDSENFSDSLVYDITDGLNTLRLTAKISIEPVNDNAPIAENDTYIGVEGGTISPVNSVLENDSDMDLYLDANGGIIGTPLYAMLEPLQLPVQGSVTMTPDGLFTYTHDGSETVNDSFAYIVVDTMQGITFTDTAKVYITIPQVAPTADSAFYYDEDGNGLIEEIVVYFNDSIDVTTTTFTAVWVEDAAPLTVLSATNVGTSGSEVSLAVEGSPVHRTSGEITVTITHGPLFESAVASVVAQDKAAPTITAATYYYDERGQGFDSLRVFFSEDVNYFIGNPYNYLDLSTGANFSMEVTAKSHVGSVITYDVVSKTIKQVNTGDSIQINIADIASDVVGNYQDLTIWAPINLEGKYPVDFEFLIIPQPMLFIKIGDKKSEAAPLNEDMMEYYNFPATAPTKGVAFILYAKMPLAAASLQKCNYTILDQTGNVVQEAQPLTFTLNADSEITGVGVWEGKNHNGRVVAKSSYLVVVDAEIMTENGEIVPFHTEKAIATYGIYE